MNQVDKDLNHTKDIIKDNFKFDLHCQVRHLTFHYL
jgi:hypothetical protein